MTALYVLAQEHRALADTLADLDIDEQTLADTLEGAAGELEQKATAVAMVIRNHEALAASIKDAEEMMAARRKALEARAERLRTYLLTNMLLAGIKSIKHPMLDITIKGKVAAVEVFDEQQVPVEFYDQPPAPPPRLSKSRIAAAIKAGRDVQGAKLSAEAHRIEIK